MMATEGNGQPRKRGCGARLLRGCGYQVTPMEFVPSKHTPKNTMLRAIRSDVDRDAAFDEYLALRSTLGGAGIKLESILPSAHGERLGEAERRRAGS